MIVEGQIMGGLTEGFAMAAMELTTFTRTATASVRTSWTT